ncbi:Homeodomain-like domain-containing protein [Halomicrobium zhouii]|uniref:Homeodomain-like domain-containing protein n=1 Tax=Halomicrobium zhouii TaxID=767519 RepID=A0A1I6K859_9EURY|nr:helix-turn-helix domain-containing protein [Halomicrobium zhouii]SFR87433.1 Homeodomain-like domain-containing protein [Halomicrobium zhouii]
MMEYVDDTAAKIVLAASDGDSIRRIAQKIDGTYSWVYSWIERLEDVGIVERNDGVFVTSPDVREGYAQLVAAISRQTPPTVAEAYVVPHFAQMPFAYTKIDAVYVWTHGGYQIARGDDAYPVFIRVRETDIERWESFFDRYDVPTTVSERDDSVIDDTSGSIYYSLQPTTESIDQEWVDGSPAIPLSETIEYMEAYRWNFEPALQMIADEYDIDIDVDRPEYAGPE